MEFSKGFPVQKCEGTALNKPGCAWSLPPLVLAIANPFSLQLGRGLEHPCSPW